MGGLKTVAKATLISMALAGLLLGAPTKEELQDMKKIVGYYPEWGVYSSHGNYNPTDMALNKMTHVNYAFATIKEGKIALFDEWAATGIASQFGEAWDSEYKGALGQFKKLKQSFPNTSFMISIGGWTQSGNFHDVAATPESRAIFVQSVLEFVREWGFDGVDIDWEYPGVLRAPDKTDNANDQGTPKADLSEKETFTLLLKDLRVALNIAGVEDERYYQLSAAVSAGIEKMQLTEPLEYTKYLDFVNLMTYDLHGAWDSKTNHQAALYPNPYAKTATLSVDESVKAMQNFGVPSNKIVIGSPFYSRGWKNVQNDGSIEAYKGLFATANGGANGIWDGGVPAGVNPYYHMKQLEQDPSFVKYYDEYAQAPYLYSESKKEMYTYEDKRSLGQKVAYVNSNGLGGIIFWEVTGDAPLKGTELLDVIYDGFYNGVVPDVPTTPPVVETPSGEIEEVESSATSWDSSKVYVAGDVVSYNGKTYKSKWWNQNSQPGSELWGPWGLTTTLGTKEEQPQTDDEVVQPQDPVAEEPTVEEPIAEKPTQTSASWDSSKVYVAGDVVTYKGKTYTAQWWTRGDTPGLGMWGVWKEIGSVNSGEEQQVKPQEPTVEEPTQTSGSWDSSKVYVAGDVVTYKGKTYTAQWWTRGDTPGLGMWGVWKEIGSSSAPKEEGGSNGTTGGGIEDGQDSQTVEEDSGTNDSGSYVLKTEDLEAREGELTNTPLFVLVKESIKTLPNEVVESISPLGGSNPSNVKRVERFVNAEDWGYLFSKRAPEYTYSNFLKAVGKFPAFCGDYSDGRDSDAICKKSLATMFAHFTQETGGHTVYWDVPEWRQGLVHVREMGWSEDMRGGYNGECSPTLWQGQTWPCGTFEDGSYKSYFGRGAKQLSYNYNYGPFSEAMTGSVRTLLDHPELVADSWYNLASAVFFFVYPQPPKPSMLHVIDGTWVPNERDISNGLVSGFGVTTQIINGGVECGGSVEVQQSQNRISYYKDFSTFLGTSVPSDEVLGCANMKQFDSAGSGALNIYWEKDWSYDASNPNGESFACKLVGYQTPYSALKKGDYAKCVDAHFDVVIE